MEETFKVELTVAELNVVLLGLGELQLKTSHGVLNNIVKQYEAQQVQRVPPVVIPPTGIQDVKPE